MQVMQRLQQWFGVSLTNFCVTLSEGNIPAHYWVNIELAPGHQLPLAADFIRKFDLALTELHYNYARKRSDRQVPAPGLRILAPGSFDQVRQQLIARGAAEFRVKFSLVSEDRHLLAGLTVEQEVKPVVIDLALSSNR